MLRTGQMYNYGDPYYRMLFDMQQKYRKRETQRMYEKRVLFNLYSRT